MGKRDTHIFHRANPMSVGVQGRLLPPQEKSGVIGFQFCIPTSHPRALSLILLDSVFPARLSHSLARWPRRLYGTRS